MISYEMMFDIYMLRSRMLNGIFGEINCTSVVTQNKDFGMPQIEIFQLMFNAQNLSIAVYCRHIFSFSN